MAEQYFAKGIEAEILFIFFYKKIVEESPTRPKEGFAKKIKNKIKNSAGIKIFYNFVSQSAFNMTIENTQHLEAIQDIRKMMKKSTRFLSLSGLSGIFAGVYALLGVLAAIFYFDYIHQHDNNAFVISLVINMQRNFLLIAISVLFLSIITAYFFSNRKAKRSGQTLFDYTALRALINLCIPLLAGAIFCVALLYHGTVLYIAPVMLLFYGMALINASKYTYDDIRYLGICEIVLGLINAFALGTGLIWWGIGFGVLHIVYGILMWYKYERSDNR